MYIKEIKINGFKSFADNVNLELNKNFTGIVGPNGSGKSNIVDALKWVMGEQSVKTLRGSNNMSELTSIIFSDEIKVEQNPKTSIHLFSGRRFGETMMKSILSVSFTEFEKYHQYADRYNKILSGEI